jgi:hypothetical protein
MVMPAEPEVIEDVQIDSDEVDSDVDIGLLPVEDEAEVSVEAGPTGVAPPKSIAETPTAQPTPPTAPPVDQRAINELHQRRAYDVQQQWQQSVGKQAREYEQKLQEGGYMPEQARDQARRYVQQEQKFRKQEQDAAEMMGFIEGRQQAAIHFLEKHGLANKQMLADLRSLQQTDTPAAMEKEAKRMKDDRALRAENARLKQGTVPPQTFDNSQGAAEATSNDQRLLDAYNNGDRSDVAVRAARRLALGS